MEDESVEKFAINSIFIRFQYFKHFGRHFGRHLEYTDTLREEPNIGLHNFNKYHTKNDSVEKNGYLYC